MITEKELQAVELSPTAKDFYQIWNELLDTATKLSNRWDPTSTNESDPGIVLLKVLTAIADKLNYTIDKNILEAFMPSATQEEAMRKLCDMLGYNMKYYQAATTTVQISYIGTDEFSGGIQIPQFTNIKNTDEDINFVTTESITLYKSTPVQTVLAIEGAAVPFETEETDNKITLSLLDDNNKLYLPESQIAENGIFISNVANDFNINNQWEKVENLNTQPLKTHCYKFGYDSKQSMPYIQFPDDISTIIDDGIYIKYIRTNGINGNIVARLLNTIEWTAPEEGAPTKNNETHDPIATSDLAVTNLDIANTGRNPESINEAYINYKKTIGTFDTLVTCRDYMNKIYQMTESYSDMTPLVSNVIVSDIRDDINKSIELCSFNEYGINYLNMPLLDNGETALIDHFDLILYPFHIYNNLNTKDDYKNSFRISDENNVDIIANLEDNKTISHDIKSPKTGEVACVKVYLKLKAKITTTKKVNAIEEKYILEAIKAALFYNFNMRKLDFGEEIPYDSLLECIQNADTRIKNVSLDEPALEVKYHLVNKTEEYSTTSIEGQTTYNKLALRNILAGRIPMFNYNESFKPSYTEKAYSDVPSGSIIKENITKLESSFTPSTTIPTGGLKLLDNEVIKFRAPNFRTVTTYPAYINYYLHLNDPTKVISNDSEYLLNRGEYLLINYTQSGEEGSTNKVYKSEYEWDDDLGDYKLKTPAIIKPSGFTTGLTDSSNYHIHHSYSKTTGYNFSEYDIQNPDGMFTLGTSEQIEIIEKINVILKDSLSYIYWIGNNESADRVAGKETTTFKFDENDEYELKDNEYFFVTTKDKISLVWYGKGTVIKKQANTPTLTKRLTNTNLTANDILTQGLAAAINWVQVDLSRENGKIEAQEYQYINLIKGDKLDKLTLVNQTIENLTSTWVACDGDNTSITFNDETELNALPKIAIPGISWEVCSLLEINMGPTTSQTLHENDKIKAYYDNTHIEYASGMSLKSNIYCQTSASEIETKYDLDNDEIPDNFMIKVFKNENVKDTTNQPIPLNNFSEYWTKFSFSSELAEIKNLNILIPDSDNQFALMMIYYSDENASTDPYTDNAYLESATPLVIYNNKDISNNDIWWNGGDGGTISCEAELTTDTEVDQNKTYYTKSSSGGATPGYLVDNEGYTYTKVDSPVDEDIATYYEVSDTGGYCYYLRPEINVIKISTNNVINIYNGTNQNGTIIFSDFDIIDNGTDYGINPHLNYYGVEDTDIPANSTTPMQELCKNINAIDKDHQFYYNTVIENSVAIDINTQEKNKDSENYETLETPSIWYDANNINNKFVISEIDADYLDTGITIAKTSKL